MHKKGGFFLYNFILLTPVDRILGLDAQLIFSWGIQFVNTIILVVILNWILYTPVVNFLDARKQRIQDNIDNANKLQKEAEDLKTKYELILSNVEQEKTGIITEAISKAKQIEEDIIQAAKKEATKIKEATKKDMELQKNKASREMKEQILDISALIAGKYVESSIDQNLQVKLLNEAIENLGEATWLN